MFRRSDRRSKDGDESLDEELEVEGEPAAGEKAKGAEDRPEDMEADLESQAADYLADNDVWLYGPYAKEVLEVIDRLEEVGPDDAEAIAESWRSAPRSDRDAARKAVRKLTERDEETARHIQMAREEIGAWLAVAAEYPEYVKAVPDWARICSQVSEAALDAVAGVILEEELEEPEYEALFLPWTDAVEKLRVDEELDEIEGDAEDEGEEGIESDVENEDVEGEFGPNTDSVADLLNRLWLLSPEQVSRLVSGWQEAPQEELERAHEALHELVGEDSEERDQVRRAQEKIAPWLNGGRLVEAAGFMGRTGQGATRQMAGPALADAVAALVVGDLLAPEDAQALYAPWFNLVGAPPLPEPDDAGAGPAGSDSAKS
ncbi:MAG: hypothetical protein ABSD62_03820 [Candidatus Limnocylindrales bacterium]|jgi:hypothetical protein